MSVPSRYGNPFATCWTRPGAVDYQFSDPASGEALIERLAASGWRGAIVGPHGSGKSTLLATLAPLLRCAGRPIRVVDGYERLSPFARWRLQRRCRRVRHGLVVTAHRSTALPTLITLAPSLEMVQQLVVHLCASIPTPIGPADVAASYARRGSNVREILFDLYNEHERRARSGCGQLGDVIVTTVAALQSPAAR